MDYFAATDTWMTTEWFETAFGMLETASENVDDYHPEILLGELFSPEPGMVYLPWMHCTACGSNRSNRVWKLLASLNRCPSSASKPMSFWFDNIRILRFPDKICEFVVPGDARYSEDLELAFPPSYFCCRKNVLCPITVCFETPTHPAVTRDPRIIPKSAAPHRWAGDIEHVPPIRSYM